MPTPKVTVVKKPAPKAKDPFRRVAESTPTMGFDITSTLHELLFHYGLNVERTGPWLFITDASIWVTTKVSPLEPHEGATGILLEVSMTSPRLEQKPMVESYAAWAHNETEAAKHAFTRFMQGSLVAMLATLVGPAVGAEEVQWEVWKLHGKYWKTCLGRLMDDDMPKGFDSLGLLRRFRDTLLPVLGPGLHWLRIDFSRTEAEELETEILLDNEPWPPGKEILDSWETWPEGASSWRQFLTLTES